MSNINKPITITRQEFIDNLIQLCNNSGLPFFVIEDVLKNIIQEIHIASQKQLEVDKQKYDKEIKDSSV